MQDASYGEFTIEKYNLPDAVLWNPWITKSKAIDDLGDEEYLEMLCVEPAAAGSGPVILDPNESWQCSQKLSWSDAVR